MKPRTKVILGLGAPLCLVAGLIFHAFLPPVAASKLAQLSKGIAEADAERLLGKPREIITPSAFGAVTWRYQVPFRFGYVDLFFEQDKRLSSYNYERF